MYSQFNPSPLSIKQFMDFGKFYFYIKSYNKFGKQKIHEIVLYFC